MTSDDRLEKLLEKHNLSEEELKNILRSGSSPSKSVRNHKHYFSPHHSKFILTGDWHAGHKDFDEKVLMEMFDVANKEDVDAVYHTGDIIEGMSGRDGHVYELSHIGGTLQFDYVCDMLSDLMVPLYFITGNHDGWMMKKNNAGFNVGSYIDDKVKDAHYLGSDEADVQLSPKVTMKLIHPGDGSAYALSYKAQKRIESFDGGNKPNIMAQGHYHKALYFFYRNVHSFDTGTLCNQTPWMRSKNLAANKGFWLVDLAYDKKGINEITPKFYPFYD
jgi:predicted phosphodiesterase